MYICLKDAVKKYGEGEAAVYALDHTDLVIGEGEICVILGPSGSGKSTILNMLGGLDTLDAGELTIEGRSLIGLTPKERTLYRKEEVGFVFQFYNLIPDLTVEENIEAVSDISESPLDLSEVLGALELEQYRRRFPRELSGGQQQRAAIARAMIKNPRLLLCDELTGALDTRSSKNVLRFVEKMNRKYGTTVVIITHNEAIAKMADQIIRIRDGRVEESVFNEKKIPAEELEL
ncbi:ABC transporter ATP-binding protein [Mediterraneibacter glycyrrhizinilyticus]|nr:ABC transporter ATP-binding protein [Mediterraneibacter glycyrrhizinilyticus]MBM6853875.1 ABC transporter ATP-binding protein [Mediterraneibacter glycyrrhizinilyticus]